MVYFTCFLWAVVSLSISTLKNAANADSFSSHVFGDVLYKCALLPLGKLASLAVVSGN